MTLPKTKMGKNKNNKVELFTAEVESLDQEGRGVARQNGKVVFIEGALPGETVEYVRIRNKPSYEIGATRAIFNESSIRTAPRCPYFGMEEGSCGGCAMQHLNPYAQVAIKQKVLVDALTHIGKVRPQYLLPPLYGLFWGYRNRARLSVRDVKKKGQVLVGFRERKSNFIADMESCEVLPRTMSDLLIPLRELIGSLSVRKELPQIEVAIAGEVIVLVLRLLVPLTDADKEKLKEFQRKHKVEFWCQPKGPDSIYPLNSENADHLKLSHPEFGTEISFLPTDFTQVNHQLNERMVSRAVRLLKLEPSDKVADFFCGLGNFTLPIATRSAVVKGMEGAPGLVERANAGAKANGLEDKVSFEARDLFQWSIGDWDRLWSEMDGVDKVLLDPPRDGADAVCKSLASTSKKPKIIVYVSCNPATLARDANTLVNEGNWVLRAAGVMNMFPHTAHVESIAVFVNKPDLIENNKNSDESRLKLQTNSQDVLDGEEKEKEEK